MTAINQTFITKIRSLRVSSSCLKYILLFAFFLAVGVFIYRSVGDYYDTFFHLKIGQYIFETRSIPLSDIYSYTAFGKPYLAHEWLSQLFFYLVYRYFSFSGLNIVCGLCAIITSAVVYKILKKRGVSFLLNLLSVAIFIITTRYFWVPRPQILGFLMLALFTYVCLILVNSKKVFILLVLFFSLVWANIHLTAILAPLLILLAAAFQSFEKKRMYNPIYALALVSFLTTLINPNTIRIYTYLFENQVLAITNQVNEFQSVIRYVNETGVQIYLFVSFISILCLATILLRSDRKTIEHRNILEMVLAILLLLLPLISYRFLPLSFMLAILFAGPHIETLIASARVIRTKFSRAYFTFMLGIASVLFISLSFYLLIYFPDRTDKNLSLFPQKAAAFIGQSNIEGSMYNPYAWGGYLLWKLGPARKVFVDGRADIYAQTYIPLYLNPLFSEINKQRPDLKKVDAAWNRLLNEYKISYIIIPTVEDQILGELLINKDGWSLVYYDAVSSILVKSDLAGKLHLKTFTGIDPFNSTRPYREGKKELAAREYLELLRADNSFTEAESNLSVILIEDNKLEEAKTHIQHILSHDSRNFSAYYNLAIIYTLQQKYLPAIQNYEKAIQYNPDFPYAYKNLAKIYLEKAPNLKLAAEYYGKYLQLNPDDPEKDTIRSILRQIQK